mmetsp:Transcript_31716/g.51322  ORF Transcript_31716/g.51322 Transcript_31716/m.51322 type:complete len:158 (-) Transcript_31716:312-785(-)|eukprot:CAMPEP_0202690142 /NCGR_PEP_ID=MMETSP1385-20130828/5234_1 /ASSEMBLY_ACC=CAM_ASM_000861 /TAXON_ID=933848 /ORGANISM="Elphidium margaritaceum" /LENGTH=157 /DNA_ID=CAMNT_0049345375 /DNA_START=58 /DNA_END=531 /DNA_ORIENTATION=-
MAAPSQPQSVAPKIKNPTKEGWLGKQSRHLRKWRPRWVVLEGATLHTFKKERDYANPTEIIDLKVFSSVKSSEDATHKSFSFDVYSPVARFSFVAKSDTEKEDWIRHIGKAIVLSNNKSVYQKEIEWNGGDDDEEDEDEEEEEEAQDDAQNDDAEKD